MSAMSVGLFGAMLLGPALPTATPRGGFAVVELFTSEGCSSCPSADRVLADLARRREQGEAIYCLGYHVDYWNKLGWTDRFSDETMTRRQAAYSRLFELGQVYTPQMVVNGSVEFVGSNRKAADQAVSRALQIAPAHTLEIVPEQRGTPKEVRFAFKAGDGAQELELTIALVQKRAESRVTRGENEGRRLAHVAIVRAFQSTKLKLEPTGSLSLALPNNVPLTELEVIGFLQNSSTGAIVAVTQAPLLKP